MPSSKHSKRVFGRNPNAPGSSTSRGRGRTPGEWALGALCCVNTPIYNDPGLSKSTCIRLMQRLMGEEYCPAEATLKKCHDGFWILAVGLSVLVRKLVTPYRAAACFKRFRNQKYAMTEYGFDLLRRHGARWPPYPEAASEIISSAAPTTTTVTTTTTTHHHRHHNGVKDFVTVTAHCDHDAPSESMMAIHGAAPEALTFSQLTMQNLLMEMMQQEPSLAVDGRIDGPIGETAVNHNNQQDSSPFSPSLELLMGVDLDVHHHHQQQVSELLAGSVMLASSETTRDFCGEDCCKSQSLNNGGAVPSVQIHNGLLTTTYAAEQEAAAALGAETVTAINDTFPAVCDIINSASLGDGTTSPAAVGAVTNMQRAAALCMLDILLGPIATQEPHSGLVEPPLLSLSRPGSGTLVFLAAGCPLS